DLTGTGQIEGSATTAQDGKLLTAGLLADKRVLIVNTSPRIQIGTRSFVLQRSPQEEGALAGSGSVQVAAAGSARIHGSLSNVQRFNQSSTISESGDVPVYAIVEDWLNL